MIVLNENKKQSLREGVDLIRSKVLEDLINILSSGKGLKIAVAGRGILMQYDDGRNEDMEVIKEIPFNFSVTNATAKVQKVGNYICPVISFKVGKDVFNIAVRKDGLFCYVNQSGYVPDWAFYAEGAEVQDFVYTKTRYLKKDTASLGFRMKATEPDDERSDASAQPLPIFDTLSFSIQTL